MSQSPSSPKLEPISSDWIHERRTLVDRIVVLHEHEKFDDLSVSFRNLQGLFAKQILVHLLPSLREEEYLLLQFHSRLLAQVNVVSQLITGTNGKISRVNPLLIDETKESPQLITEIDLSSCITLSDEELIEICNIYPYLKKLSLKNCYNLSLASLQALSRLAHLEYLEIQPELFVEILPEAISHIAPPNLFYVKIGQHATVNHHCFIWLGSLPALQTLNLTGTHFDPYHLFQIKQKLALLILDNPQFHNPSELGRILSHLSVSSLSLLETNLISEDVIKIIRGLVQKAPLSQGNFERLILDRYLAKDLQILREAAAANISLAGRYLASSDSDSSPSHSLSSNGGNSEEAGLSDSDDDLEALFTAIDLADDSEGK